MTQGCELVVLLAVFEDTSELNVVKVATLDWRLSVHLVNLSTQQSTALITRQLSYRKDDHAMHHIYGCIV